MSYVICPACGEHIPIFEQPDHKRPDGLEPFPLLGRLPLESSFAQRITQEHPLLQPEPSGLMAEAFLEIAQSVLASVE